MVDAWSDQERDARDEDGPDGHEDERNPPAFPDAPHPIVCCSSMVIRVDAVGGRRDDA